ncbi:VOC family protein [Pseudoteredinibacter isoporae]|uniref:VOC family protein n=1 Tax=Pseudoteredinibacter isoporae TaxID=570281 RepID=UPI0031027202
MMKKIVTLMSCFLVQLSWAAESPFLGVGVVVDDIPSALPAYQQALGIKQWKYIDLNVASGAIRMARAEFKGKHFDLLQPLYGQSKVADFLAQRGPGIFHVQVAPDYLQDQAAKRLATLEMATSDNSHLTNSKPYQQTWLDSYAQLGVYLSSSESSPKKNQFWGVADVTEEQASAPLDNARLAQIGIVVASADKTAKAWKQLLGLGPWLFVDFKPPMTSNGQYLGAVGQAYSEVHVAYGQWFDLQIELLQPVAGPTPHRDYLRRYGNGAHHFSLGRLPEHDQLQAHLQSAGIQLQMQSDNGGEGRTATYMASEKELGWVLEFTKAFKGLGSLKVVKQLP